MALRLEVPKSIADDVKAKADAAIRAAVEAEQEACCRDVCDICWSPTTHHAAEIIGGAWKHRWVKDPMKHLDCEAAEIRNR